MISFGTGLRNRRLDCEAGKLNANGQFLVP